MTLFPLNFVPTLTVAYSHPHTGDESTDTATSMRRGNEDTNHAF
jgi:hypothetical protein